MSPPQHPVTPRPRPARTVMRRRWLVLGLLAVCVPWLAFAPRPAQAAGDRIEVRSARLQPVEEGHALDADFVLELSERLEDVVNRGLALYFVTEFELSRERWYWFDERPVELRREWRLSYHALTRQYRLATGSFQQRFDTLAEALGALSRVRGWKVIERGQVRQGQAYVAALRLRLDVAQLPKPFQVNAITNRDWNPVSEWKRFSFVPGLPMPDAPRP